MISSLLVVSFSPYQEWHKLIGIVYKSCEDAAASGNKFDFGMFLDLIMMYMLMISLGRQQSTSRRQAFPL
jgi:hypothetical protein